MNIFVLDNDPVKAAEYHCDSHVCKMMVETAQMLGSCIWFSNNITSKKEINSAPFQKKESIWKNFPRTDLNGVIQPYGIGYMNHPCTKWARESRDNYEWLCILGISLCGEYMKRYNNISSVFDIIVWFHDNAPELPDIGLTPFAQAMPDHLKSDDAVQSYKQYYIEYKASFAKWKLNTPDWWNELIKNKQ